jgi:hypothetical protein
VSKETYCSVKRDLLQCQKRPTTVSKETYYSVKRDLLQCQKRLLRAVSFERPSKVSFKSGGQKRPLVCNIVKGVVMNKEDSESTQARDDTNGPYYRDKRDPPVSKETYLS